MKNLYLLSLILFNCFLAHAQQFSFPIYFQDAAGNRDTIVLGYDNAATDSIDSFDGTNIISQPWKSVLDVRITNEYYRRYMSLGNGSYHTKRNIKKTSCQFTTTTNTLEIVSNNWPITASWDSSLFSMPCTQGSFFTSIHPGAWWDASSGSSNLGRQLFSTSSSVTFTSNHYPGFTDENSSYVAGPDTVDVFWFGLGDSTLIATSVQDHYKHNVKVFPNPAADFLTIDADLIVNSMFLALDNLLLVLRDQTKRQ
jgi:hypothetical protein